VQVAHKNTTAVAFHSVHFSNALSDPTAFTLPVAQELDKIHILYARKFCRPTLGVRVIV